jgi:hypothetical protein
MDLVTVEVVLDTMEGILNSLVSVVEVDFLSNLEAWACMVEVWVALEEEVDSLNSLEVWVALEEEVTITIMVITVEDSSEVVVDTMEVEDIPKCLEVAWEEVEVVTTTDVTETRL